MKKQQGFTAIELLYVVFGMAALALAVGWVMNIFDIVPMLGGDVNAMFIARLVGVFVAPLGGVLGYF